jgi:hypothetical protein
MKKSILYISANPEGLVGAPVGSIFYRNNQKFYQNDERMPLGL